MKEMKSSFIMGFCLWFWFVGVVTINNELHAKVMKYFCGLEKTNITEAGGAFFALMMVILWGTLFAKCAIEWKEKDLNGGNDE